MTCTLNTLVSLIIYLLIVSKNLTAFLSLFVFEYKSRLLVHAVEISFFFQRIGFAKCLSTDPLSYTSIAILEFSKFGSRGERLRFVKVPVISLLFLIRILDNAHDIDLWYKFCLRNLASHFDCLVYSLNIR